MRNRKGLLAILAALTTAGFVGCLNNADTSAEVMALPSETSALVAFAADSTRPAPARRQACDTLTARLAVFDTASPQYSGLYTAVSRVCAEHPKAPKPKPLSPRCQDLMAEIALADSGSAAYDSLWAIARAQCFPAPQPPPLKPGCAEAWAARNQADSGTALFDSLGRVAAQICGLLPKSEWSPKCDSLAAAIALADTLTPARDSAQARFLAHCRVQPKPVKPDSLRPVPPVRPDSVRPQPAKPDSVRPVPPARPDSGFTPPRDPVKPVPPKKPVKDSASAE